MRPIPFAGAGGVHACGAGHRRENPRIVPVVSPGQGCLRSAPAITPARPRKICCQRSPCPTKRAEGAGEPPPTLRQPRARTLAPSLGQDVLESECRVPRFCAARSLADRAEEAPRVWRSTPIATGARRLHSLRHLHRMLDLSFLGACQLRVGRLFWSRV